MRAYDESYLNDAMDTLGEAFDYAVFDCEQDADEFYRWFIFSGIADAFGAGNPRYIAGMSGVELAQEIRFRVTGERADIAPTQSLDRTPEYWAGWFIAYYQWHRAIRFEEMARRGLLPSVMIDRFVLHEADISKSVEIADRIMEDGAGQTRLAFLRQQRGFTQRQLAEAADVSLRMVQLYEQRQNDLAKASAGVVQRIARALGCAMEDLME